MMATQLEPALPGERPAAVTTNMLSYVAARLYSPTAAAADGAGTGSDDNGMTAEPAPTSAGGAAFAVPPEALALGGRQPVDQLLLVLAYDAHAAAGKAASAVDGSALNGSSSAVNGASPVPAPSPICGTNATNGSNGNNTNGTTKSNCAAAAAAAAGDDIASAPRAAGTASLVLRGAGPGGAEIPVRSLAVPLGFSLNLLNGGEALHTPPCYLDDGIRGPIVLSGVNASAPRESIFCSFFDEETELYSTEGCATLPNPYPPGGEVKWLPGVKAGAVKLAAGEEAFLWAFSHPTLLRNCSLNWTLPADNATRLRVYEYDGAGAATCPLEVGPDSCRPPRHRHAF